MHVSLDTHFFLIFVFFFRILRIYFYRIGKVASRFDQPALLCLFGINEMKVNTVKDDWPELHFLVMVVIDTIRLELATIFQF